MQFKRLALVAFMVLSVAVATFTIAVGSAEAAAAPPDRRGGNPACGVIAGLAALLNLPALDMVLGILGCDDSARR
jgi:hypothetical protein